ncbi:MAG: hypothetical protein HWE27_01510 [Gammaproteobacteria bacterium]|nr:hypothetical protein [Gammaproteobacteria bacterium]
MTSFKTIAVFCCLVLSGCDINSSDEFGSDRELEESEKNLLLFKQTYQSGLIDLCRDDRACEALINKHFSRCLNDKLALQLLSAEQEDATELSIQLTDQTMACIERAKSKDNTSE